MMNREIAIVGAGLTGLVLSIYLAKRGYNISIYDQRPDPRMSYYKYSSGRSMSLDISLRGLTALSEIGLNKEILSYAIPMRKRILHLPNDELIELLYDTSEKYNIHAISRSEIHKYLLNEAEKISSVKVKFNQKYIDVDRQSDNFTFLNENNEYYQISPFLLIGCDGANSAVRKSIERELDVSFRIDNFKYQYKELSIPSSLGKKLEFQAMHMWPRENCMLVAQPNYDGSFTCALLLPIEGEHSFKFLINQPKDKLLAFFKNQFGEIYSLIPNLLEEFINNPVGSLTTISEGRWNLDNRILLIGDSVHAMVPFLGQGVNACFEDCYLLNKYLDKFNDDWECVISEFEKNRKIDTNAISTMSLENYPELINPNWRYFILHREIEDFLTTNFKDLYISYHNMVCFDLVPYRYANAVRALQKELIIKISSIINNIKEIKKEIIKIELEEYKNKVASLQTELRVAV